MRNLTIISRKYAIAWLVLQKWGNHGLRVNFVGLSNVFIKSNKSNKGKFFGNLRSSIFVKL